jgi:hypothetical protein
MKQMKLALEYQLAECYIVVRGKLIDDTPDIEGALNYLASDNALTIAELDELLTQI